MRQLKAFFLVAALAPAASGAPRKAPGAGVLIRPELRGDVLALREDIIAADGFCHDRRAKVERDIIAVDRQEAVEQGSLQRLPPEQRASRHAALTREYQRKRAEVRAKSQLELKVLDDDLRAKKALLAKKLKTP